MTDSCQLSLSSKHASRACTIQYKPIEGHVHKSLLSRPQCLVTSYLSDLGPSTQFLDTYAVPYVNYPDSEM